MRLLRSSCYDRRFLSCHRFRPSPDRHAPRLRSIYLSAGLNLLAPIISFKLYWLLVAVPALGGYKLWIFAKPFLAQKTAAAQSRAAAAIDGANANGAGAAESSSKRAEKMKKKQEKLERAQTGGRGARR